MSDFEQPPDPMPERTTLTGFLFPFSDDASEKDGEVPGAICMDAISYVPLLCPAALVVASPEIGCFAAPVIVFAYIYAKYNIYYRHIAE